MINARGGSVGVPRKNIRPLNGKPLIGYSIEVALQTPELDRVIVSTDDQEIASVAEGFGAEVPFMRPDYLATSQSVQIETIAWNVAKLEEMGEVVDVVVLLQPTAPLRSSADISGCVELLEGSKADTVITVTDVGSRHPTGIYRMSDSLDLEPFARVSASGFNRQSLEAVYWRTGAVYAIKRDVIMEKSAIYGEIVKGYVVPEERSFNIDTIFDFELAEAWLQYEKRKS